MTETALQRRIAETLIEHCLHFFPDLPEQLSSCMSPPPISTNTAPFTPAGPMPTYNTMDSFTGSDAGSSPHSSPHRDFFPHPLVDSAQEEGVVVNMTGSHGSLPRNMSSPAPAMSSPAPPDHSKATCKHVPPPVAPRTSSCNSPTPPVSPSPGQGATHTSPPLPKARHGHPPIPSAGPNQSSVSEREKPLGGRGVDNVHGGMAVHNEEHDRCSPVTVPSTR